MSRTISVTAEWALRGKTRDDRGYRLLGCSDGDLRRQNFEEAIDRFSPGTLEILPQVSVSYLTRADQAGGSYLSLAVHELAEEGQFDAAGREVTFTRYFCVPYEQLASDAISYQAMYESFRPIRLSEDEGAPLPVTISAASLRVPVDDQLALQVAALLLTGSVCVLGADRTSVEDRLRFIDAVMSLLPYGLRSRMSASTWTSSTYQTHRLRLFFSDAPRGDEGRDHLVRWGQLAEITPDLGYAYDYLGWLEEKVQQPVLRLSELTELTDEYGFKPKQVLQMLERIGIADANYPADHQDLLHPTRTPPRASKTYAETLLLWCVQWIKEGNMGNLKSDIVALRNHTASSSIRNDDRLRYQDIISKHQLLKPGQPLGRVEDKFFGALLGLAFGFPLSYQSYCQVESCLGIKAQEVPHRALLEAISHGGIADPRVSAIVLSLLGERRLHDWFRSGRVDIKQLIGWLAGDWDRRYHARIVCDVIMRYLKEMRATYDPATVRVALRNHDYLAQTLSLRYPANPEYQVLVLRRLLLAATGGVGLNQPAIIEVMTGTRKPPTPALLVAVLLLLGDPADGVLAKEKYLAGLLRYMELSEEIRDDLDQYTPGGIFAAEPPALERAPQQAERSRPPDDGHWQYPAPPTSPLEQVRGMKELPAGRRRRITGPLVQKFDRSKPDHGQS